MCISTIFMSPMNMSPARAELFGKYERIGALSAAEQADLNREWRELDKSEALWAADFEDYMTMVLRSEEHTSELQSLMRISYAVFCLKKKKTRQLKPCSNKQRWTTE